MDTVWARLLEEVWTVGCGVWCFLWVWGVGVATRCASFRLHGCLRVGGVGLMEVLMRLEVRCGLPILVVCEIDLCRGGGG